MGDVRVPSERKYGAQTARALRNFAVPPPGLALGDHPDLIHAVLAIKRAAARANVQIEAIDQWRGRLIEEACVAIATGGDWRQEFPVNILHGGGGTSANMNVNEVVAHVANAIARGDDRSDGSRVDPLDHVNKNQSTNDVYPTACRLSVIERASAIVSALRTTEERWSGLSQQIGDVPRLARTCLQDAVESNFSALLGGYLAATARCRLRLERAIEPLHIVSIGGGVAGQPNASPEAYRRAVIQELGALTRREKLRLTNDFADAAQNSDQLLDLTQALEMLARILLKQAHDLRLLSSGPEGGIGEVILPAVQPGSSAIPGKVNPVIPEFVIQCSMQTISACSACGMAIDHAELDLNVWEGVFAYNASTSLSLLVAAVEAWNAHCLSDLQIDEDLNRARAATIAPRLAIAVQQSSYSCAAKGAETAPDDRSEAKR
jgi:aspartate ammonia-lyase